MDGDQIWQMKKVKGRSNWKQFFFYKLFQLKKIVIKRIWIKFKGKTN
jgi:hypothetical protein